MSPPARYTDSNSLQLRTVISATPEAVWTAFTDPVHLVRWFPTEASVVPGVGGNLRLAWGDTCSAWEISAWYPCELLEVEQLLPFASKNEEFGAGESRNSSSGWRIWIEEVSRIQTLVVLEHFGFDSLEHSSPGIRSIVSRGWEFEMFSLRYYLERQFGRDRSTVWVKRNLECEMGREIEVWESLLGDTSATPGEVDVENVEIAESPWQFAATLANPASTLLRVKLQRLDQNEIEVNLWLAAYGVSAARLQNVQADFEQRADWLKYAKTREFSCGGMR